MTPFEQLSPRLQSLAKAVLTLLVWAPGAGASGFYFGENGTKALLQGGAFAGQADDLTAIQHNPAGLAQLSGFHFLLDGGLVNHDVTFLRKDPGAATTSAGLVSNTGGVFVLPNLGLGYGLKLADRPLTLAFGAYGPPSVGRYHFPEPNYLRDPSDSSKYLATPRKNAPQRYALIENDVILLFPSLSVAYEVHPRLAVGASFQYVVSKLYFAQAVYSGISTPQRQAAEDPEFDSVVKVDVNGKPTFTAVFGAMFRPTDSLSIGASVRPPFAVSAPGKFIIQPGEYARRFNTDVQCPDRLQTGGTDENGNGQIEEAEILTIACPQGAELNINMPLELKLGAHFQPTEAIGINADLVYQGWQAMQEIVLVPKDIAIKVGAGEPSAVETFHIPKKWRGALSARLGGSYALGFGLTAYAGAFLEQSGIADEYTNIDFLHFDRLFVTAGAGYLFGRIEVIAGAAFTPAVTKEIEASEVRAGSTDAAVPGGIIGVGTYTSGGWIASLGVRGSFGNTP